MINFSLLSNPTKVNQQTPETRDVSDFILMFGAKGSTNPNDKRSTDKKQRGAKKRQYNNKRNRKKRKQHQRGEEEDSHEEDKSSSNVDDSDSDTEMNTTSSSTRRASFAGAIVGRTKRRKKENTNMLASDAPVSLDDVDPTRVSRLVGQIKDAALSMTFRSKSEAVAVLKKAAASLLTTSTLGRSTKYTDVDRAVVDTLKETLDHVSTKGTHANIQNMLKKEILSIVAVTAKAIDEDTTTKSTSTNVMERMGIKGKGRARFKRTLGEHVTLYETIKIDPQAAEEQMTGRDTRSDVSEHCCTIVCPFFVHRY